MTIQNAEANCPSCNADVDVQDIKYPGEIIICGACQEELEVESLTPVNLTLAPEAEEDWGE